MVGVLQREQLIGYEVLRKWVELNGYYTGICYVVGLNAYYTVVLSPHIAVLMQRSPRRTRASPIRHYRH